MGPPHHLTRRNRITLAEEIAFGLFGALQPISETSCLQLAQRCACNTIGGSIKLVIKETVSAINLSNWHIPAT